MKIATQEIIKEIDRVSIEDLGIPGMVLMELAGEAVANYVIKDTSAPKRVVIVCGPGNNGGDGFVAARHLFNNSMDFKVILLSPTHKLQCDALTNYNILEKLKIEPVIIEDETKIPLLQDILIGSDIIIDAIFGTGLKKPLSGIYKQVVDVINNSGKKIIAVDVPTGINSDTGHVMGCAVKADITITMGLPKLGFYLPPGYNYTGEIRVEPLSFPKHLLCDHNIPYNLIEKNIFMNCLPAYTLDINKGSRGKTLLIGGSTGFSGAIALSAMASLRAGVGLVYTAVPDCINNVIENKITEAISIPLPFSKEGQISEFDIDLNRFDSLAIGPGMGKANHLSEIILKILNEFKGPIVIDADAINNLQGKMWNGRKNIILTPHPGELARLLETQINKILENPIGAVRAVSEKYNCICVLKKYNTIISDFNGEIYINKTGNYALSTGGTGDVLTGIIAAFLAGGISPLKSACMGVYLHGKIADEWVKDKYALSMKAGDLIELLPSVLNNITS